jgi:hypothetical protein
LRVTTGALVAVEAGAQALAGFPGQIPTYRVHFQETRQRIIEEALLAGG